MRKINLLKRGVKSTRISEPVIPRTRTESTKNDIPCHTFHTEGVGAVKLEIVFEAGRVSEKRKMIAQACGALLVEGSTEFSSEELSEKIDFEGAHLSSRAGTDFISMKLICSKQSFPQVLDLMKPILNEPLFDEKELEVFKERKRQSLAIDLSKNDLIAYRTITESLYGQGTTYGYNSSMEFLDKINVVDLADHFKATCTRENTQIFLSGDFQPEHLQLIDNISNGIEPSRTAKNKYENVQTKKEEIKIAGRENQTCLKLGLRLFDRFHKDYPGLYLLNTILGGYFGSRLMKNIREKRGYTYNIYTILDLYKYDGNWIISCEMDHSNLDNTIAEIGNEFERLKNEKLHDAELEMVKNYLMGNFMSTINGPFKGINPSKTIKLMSLQDNYYNVFFEIIQSLNKEDIMRLANDYLHIDTFWKVIVGKD